MAGENAVLADKRVLTDVAVMRTLTEVEVHHIEEEIEAEVLGEDRRSRRRDHGPGSGDRASAGLRPGRLD